MGKSCVKRTTQTTQTKKNTIKGLACTVGAIDAGSVDAVGSTPIQSIALCGDVGLKAAII